MREPITGEPDRRGNGIGLMNLIENLPRRSSFKNIFTLVKIVTGMGLLVLSVQGVQWGNLVEGIRSANIVWLGLAILAVLLGLFLKIYRWAILVRNYQIQTSFAKLSRAFIVGQAVNIILPFRGGELVRMGYFASDGKVLAEIAATIVLEKYLDLLGLTICGLLVSFKFSLDNIMNLRGWLLPASIILTLFFLVTILVGPEIWKKIRSIELLPRCIIEWVDRWVLTSQWLRDPRRVLPTVWLTFLIWGGMWITNLLLFNSLGLRSSGTAAGLVLILVYVGLLPALMPGNIGPFYFFARVALLPFGILNDRAFIFAVMLHFIVTLPPLLGGAVSLFVRPGHMVSS